MANSWAVRVLPMPGSPTNVTKRPRPESASSKHPFRSPISRCRPTNTPPAKLSRACPSSVGAGFKPAPTSCRSNASKAANTSVADWGRSAGSLANKRRINASNARGQSLLCQVGATGGVLMCWPMIATGSSPRNGGLPVTISWSIAPNE